MKPRVYHLFRPADPAPRTRGTIAVLLLIAVLATALAVQKVRSRHEVIRLGYQLSKATEDVRQLREVRRQLELERATLTNPERIRALAAALGLTTVPPDQIRVVPGGRHVATAAPAAPRPVVEAAP